MLYPSVSTHAKLRGVVFNCIQYCGNFFCFRGGLKGEVHLTRRSKLETGRIKRQIKSRKEKTRTKRGHPHRG